jgi:NTE family protein
MTPVPPTTAASTELGLVLTGGGARGAYQVGVLRWIARNYPELHIPILTGASAGAINAAKLASHADTFPRAVSELARLWSELRIEKVFESDAGSIGSTAVRWGMRLMSGGSLGAPRVRGFLDTTPLRKLLEEGLEAEDGVVPGIDYNLSRGTLKALAVIATSYTTVQTVIFTRGRDVQPWTRPQRRAEKCTITVDHIMASASLPIFFPAVRVGNAWYGDGGIRLVAPLSPALHLGANRILAVSTRYDRSRAETDTPIVTGYPPPAQVLGTLLNAVFLDLVDQDVLRLERLNRLLEQLPPDRRDGLRLIDILVLRPSRDLGALAASFEPQLPRAFRFMTRGLGTRETRSPDLLSLLMFQPDYIATLMDLGDKDAEARADELGPFLEAELGRLSA